MKTLPVLVTSLLGASALAQTRWVELAVAHRPFARERHAMVYDPARGEIVLFGGYNGAAMNDTWTFSNGDWHQRTTSPTPPARTDHALAYDPVRQVVVLMGGYNAAPVTDIWEWNGSAWTQRATNVTGLGQFGAACYDPTQGGVFYNLNTNNVLWDGTSANVVTVANPTGSSQHSLVFDAASGGILSISGQYTLRFSRPQGWQQPWSYSQVFSLSAYGLAGDPAHSRVLFHGGQGTLGNSSGTGNTYTFEWNGANWAQLTNDGPALAYQAMVFTPQLGFAMFGGHDNGQTSDRTWRLQEASTPAAFQVFGAGCSGALAQAPRLAADLQWNAAPVLGGLFFVALDQLPAGQLTLGFIGTSNATWNGSPLPYALASAGMPGCDLWVRPDLTLGLGASTAAGTREWVTAIPNVPRLLGVTFYQQAAVLAPGANAAGAVWSNGGQGIVGVR